METPISIAIIENFKIRELKNKGCKKDTKFQAASLSKLLTALLILKLIEERKLNLNKDVNNYLKNFRIKNKKGCLTKITLKQILSHTAGINVSGFPGYENNSKIPTLNQILNGKKSCNTNKIFVKYKQNKYHYSGGGYLILQEIIENVSGKKFEELMRNEIFKPLKMNNSDYKIRKSKNLKIYPEKAAAGLWTTAEDLSKFLIEIQLSYLGKSNKIISKQMIKKMSTPIIKAERNFMGLGFFISKNKKYFYHSGHNHNFRSFIKGSIKNGKGFIIMINSDKEDLINRLRNKLNKELVKKSINK